MDKKELLIELGKNIKNLRTSRGYTQQEFALKYNFGVAWLGRVERGEKNISSITLMKICLAFNVEINQIFPEKSYLEKYKAILIDFND